MKLINPETGQAERVPNGVLYNYTGDFNAQDPRALENAREYVEAQRGRIPDSVYKWLELAEKKDIMQPVASAVTWEDVLTPRRMIAADGTQVLNTATETIMTPDFTFAGDALEVGDLLRYTLFFDISTIAGAQTQTYRLRWGGVGGTALATSGAFQADPTAVSTTVSQMIEWTLVCRSVGAAGSIFCMGILQPSDFDDATVTTLQGNLNMTTIPPSAPAAVGSLDTTTAKALSPTIAFSVATATVQCTTHIAFLESLN